MESEREIINNRSVDSGMDLLPENLLLNEFCQNPEFLNRLKELTEYFRKYPEANGFLAFHVSEHDEYIFFRNYPPRNINIDLNTTVPKFQLSRSENALAYELINGILTPSFRRRYAHLYGGAIMKEEAEEWSQRAKNGHKDDKYGWFANYYPGWWTYNHSFGEKNVWYGEPNAPKIPISIAISNKATRRISKEGRYKTFFGGHLMTRHRVSHRDFAGIVLENAPEIYVDRQTNKFITDGSYSKYGKDRDEFEEKKKNAYILPKDKQKDILCQVAKNYGEFVQHNSIDNIVLPIFDSLGNLMWPIEINNDSLLTFLENKFKNEV